MPISGLSGIGAATMTPGQIEEARRTGFDPTAAARAPKQEMDSEMFMKLLVTQLTNQDPSSPMDTNEMVSQTTELAAMEQLTAMATSQESLLEVSMMMLGASQRGTATDMIGKVVTTDGLDGEPVTGIATAVTFSATGEPMISIDDELHPLSTIAAVTAIDPDDR